MEKGRRKKKGRDKGRGRERLVAESGRDNAGL